MTETIPNAPKSASQSPQSAMTGKLIAAVVVTAVIVGGAMYGWQQFAQDADERTSDANQPSNKKASEAPSVPTSNSNAISSVNTNQPAVQTNQSTNTNTTTSLSLYFVALEDDGKSGEKIGCGDSLVSVLVPSNHSVAPLTSAVQQLLGVDEQFYGKSGLYNALYQSNLNIASVVIENSIATVKLTGSTKLSGACDTPRVQEQLERTAGQFPDITRVDIFINDVPLAEYLSAD